MPPQSREAHWPPAGPLLARDHRMERQPLRLRPRASHPAVTRRARRGGDRPSRTGPSTTPMASTKPPNGASHFTHAPSCRTQPEVAARAVLYAADHPRRREYWVGGSTAGTLAANAVAPGMLDRFLARTGFDAQQTRDQRPTDQPANLWEPADGSQGRDFGAHGLFDARSKDRSMQLWASHHHGLLCGAMTATLAAAAGMAARRVLRWRR